MSESDASDNEEGAAASPRDASLRVDPKSLNSDDQAFAQMMGFGGDADAPEPASAPKKAAAKPLGTVAPTARADTGPADTSTDEAAAPFPDTHASEDSPAEPPAAGMPAEPVPDSPPTRTHDWEEIHPRAAAMGRQSALLERADRVMKLEPDSDSTGLRERLRLSAARIEELEAAARETEARPALTSGRHASNEKEVDALQLELDTLLQERDRLGDELAAAHTARAEAHLRAERFEAALRATRTPGGPVPEGEQDLRAEVIGLRRRLEESGAESRRMRETLDAQATDLAIACAHRDDRRHELDQQRERLESLERDRALELEHLEESLARQRELLALVSRVQAENAELRSAQAALEETLEARDLEIRAHEEHLEVTRRGLATRDEQRIELETRLEHARHRHELLEAELERARLVRAEQEERVQRGEARIASLSTTLARIEDAIGRPLPKMPVAGKATASPISPARVSVPLARPALQPPVFAAWRDDKLQGLCGEGMTVHGFLAQQLVERFASSPPTPLRITSLGGARLEAEVELARALAALGVVDLAIRVLEPSAEAADARRRTVESSGLSASISIAVWDDAGQPAGDAPHALLLSDVLWGQPQPGALLDRLTRTLTPDGLVLFADRIAGGPLELSATTLEKLAELWQVLPESWTERAAFASPPSAADDGGAGKVREDAVAALFERFTPRATLGFGHLADLVVGPARGPALSDWGSAADALLTSIDAIDESRSILESLPPRHGVAIFVRRAAGDASESDEGEVIGLAWAKRSR